MLLHAISHRPGTSNAYTVSHRYAELRLRTGPDIQRVSVVYGDKYDWEHTRNKVAMRPMGSDDLFLYWRTTVHCPVRRLRYCFFIETKDESVWLTEEGLRVAAGENPQGLFDFPWLHQSDGLEIPDWIRDAVFYQIFPDRFANGDPSNDPEDLTPWHEQPTSHSLHGGDLEGIAQKLDYLCDLGINTIYLTPIFYAPSNHKYDTIDYFSIDPHFGSIETLQKLVSLCHQRGIRVVLDAVFNHIGWQSPQFQDAVLRGAESSYYNWFHFHDLPSGTRPRPTYDTFAYAPSMPKLNTQNKEVQEYLLNVATYWIEVADIDGWRFDVADEVDHEFWRKLRHRVRAVKPTAYILGEIVHQAEPWLRGDQFDGVMNYPLTEALTAWLTGKGSAASFANRITQLHFDYSRPALEGCLNLLDSHDTPRLLSQLGGNRPLLKLAAVILLTLPGAPCIYYGDEVGMEGGPDPDCRRAMIWDTASWDLNLLSWYKQLIALRLKHRALRRGDLAVVTLGEHLLGWSRQEENGDELLVLINRGAEPAPLTTAIPDGQWFDLLTGTIYQAHHEIPPSCALIMQRLTT
ncbi:MAG: glycoside hydrolase family 13 protein [Peptococcaceae bacterium]|nr:glycoside hydrolase family 13 protein [Peptococcaceae bacterium]